LGRPGEDGRWQDEIGRTWDEQIRFSLPDKDMFAINAMSSKPKLVGGRGGDFAGVGTVLFNMVVNPSNGNVYVTNTEARKFTSAAEAPPVSCSTSGAGASTP
jgi:hypothetical protein